MQIRGAIRKLLVFGAPRVPADIALFGLFALPAYASVHRNDTVSAGYLSVGLSLVQAIATAFASVGFVLLPYWSRAAKDAEARLVASKRVGILLIGSGVMATLGLALMQLLLVPIVQLLLGPLAAAGLHDIRYVLLGAVPYVIYLVLRDYFDAIAVFPFNTVALGAAIVVQAALLNMPGLGIPLATALSFLALGMIMMTFWVFSLQFQRRTLTGNGATPVEV
jgi:O-antigen/teichoic acid export membrane protein